MIPSNKRRRVQLPKQSSDLRMRRKAQSTNEQLDEETSDSREPIPLDPSFMDAYSNGNARITVIGRDGPTITAENQQDFIQPQIIETDEHIYPIAFEEVEVVEPGNGGDYSDEYLQEGDNEEPSQTFLPDEEHLVSVF
ncbi:unnamed protein product [Anisakis simplex]|uniref:Uncharacterized protein n=1 Tax=Anisakis simplex TaxID=6269 RepID=A0A0M3K5D0_ANISI|nr:unnamed protein product [Anisakis simplex]